MKYNIMRLICMFDLPTDTEYEKREYRIFRKYLIKNGFEMLQYSVYVRTCPDRSFAKKFDRKLRQNSPISGNIKLLFITEKQFEDMVTIIGKKDKKEQIIGSNELVVI